MLSLKFLFWGIKNNLFLIILPDTDISHFSFLDLKKPIKFSENRMKTKEHSELALLEVA